METALRVLAIIIIVIVFLWGAGYFWGSYYRGPIASGPGVSESELSLVNPPHIIRFPSSTSGEALIADAMNRMWDDSFRRMRDLEIYYSSGSNYSY